MVLFESPMTNDFNGITGEKKAGLSEERRIHCVCH
jgi:hypothetical protein